MVFASTTSFAVGTAALFSTVQVINDEKGREAFCDAGMNYYVPTMQGIDFTFLTVTIVAVFHRLSIQESLADDIQAFKKERRTLVIILIIFDCSYILRSFYDIFWS